MAFSAGDRVEITERVDASWWPKGVVTGTVVRYFNNKKIAIDVDQLRNKNGSFKTMHFEEKDLKPTDIPAPHTHAIKRSIW